jgi:hypothetical protein
MDLCPQAGDVWTVCLRGDASRFCHYNSCSLKGRCGSKARLGWVRFVVACVIFPEIVVHDGRLHATSREAHGGRAGPGKGRVRLAYRGPCGDVVR